MFIYMRQTHAYGVPVFILEFSKAKNSGRMKRVLLPVQHPMLVLNKYLRMELVAQGLNPRPRVGSCRCYFSFSFLSLSPKDFQLSSKRIH